MTGACKKVQCCLSLVVSYSMTLTLGTDGITLVSALTGAGTPSSCLCFVFRSRGVFSKSVVLSCTMSFYQFVALPPSTVQAMLGQPESAARALEGLLSLQLKLSYLSAMTPTALNDYTHSQVNPVFTPAVG